VVLSRRLSGVERGKSGIMKRCLVGVALAAVPNLDSDVIGSEATFAGALMTP
jgi:hypothetical protein